MASPVKERYGDRFIPSRTGNNWETNFNMITVSIWMATEDITNELALKKKGDCILALSKLFYHFRTKELLVIKRLHEMPVMAAKIIPC